MIVTKAQMKAIEDQANANGLSYLQMMENAGRSAFEAIIARRPDLHRAAVFCGTGNNGGDGYVVARLLREWGAEVLLVLVGGKPKTADAITNFYRAAMADIPMVVASLLTEEDAAWILSADLLVDAIYGTGFRGELSLEAEICSGAMGKSHGYKAALDLPSGLECDTGRIAEGTAAVDLTITFHAEKPCHGLAPQLCGEVLVADIGIKE